MHSEAMTIEPARAGPQRHLELWSADPPEAVRNPRILDVDDDDAIRTLMTGALADAGYDVVPASSAAAALALLAGHEVALIVSDLTMPGRSGIELLGAIRQAGSTVPFIIVTGSDMDRHAGAAAALRVAAVLPKPFPLAELGALVARELRA
jgi:CheY-like chemotaxis protein